MIIFAILVTRMGFSEVTGGRALSFRESLGTEEKPILVKKYELCKGLVF